MGGSRIEDWVHDQAMTLSKKVKRATNPIAKDDEQLWESLKTAFERSFTYTNKVEDTKHQLARLEMQADNIDNYIAKFENLVHKAGIPCQEQGILDRFKDGLKRGIHAAILWRDQWPTNLDQWQEQARCKVRRFSIIRDSLGDKGNPYLSTHQFKWKELAQKALHCPKRDDVILMDIDAGQIEEMGWKSKAKIEKLCQEGQCFQCLKQGHMKCDCPNKQGGTKRDKPSRPPIATWAVYLHEEDKKKPESKLKELQSNINGLDQDGRDALFEALVNGPSDF